MYLVQTPNAEQPTKIHETFDTTHSFEKEVELEKPCAAVGSHVNRIAVRLQVFTVSHPRYTLLRNDLQKG